MTPITPEIDPTWLKALKEEFSKPYFIALKQFLIEERKSYTIYPKGSAIFSAYNHTPLDKTNVVILGQDPYHGPGQANGLCFSVHPGVATPPSLVNIFKELSSDLQIPIPSSGDLTPWAQQGVLLLNATLTVRHKEAGSHQNKGWETFTDETIRVLSAQKEGLIFLLWGSYAIKKAQLIDTKKHHILTAPHPSPLSVYRGFLGCKHFSKTNELLKQQNKPIIHWAL